jgi:hypothetical protein
MSRRLYQIGSHKTSVFTDSADGFTKVIYWNTAVVSFNNSRIKLDSGGYETLTTKTRMNQASRQFNLDFRVFQKDFDWFVEYRGKVFNFSDGMILER